MGRPPIEWPKRSANIPQPDVDHRDYAGYAEILRDEAPHVLNEALVHVETCSVSELGEVSLLITLSSCTDKDTLGIEVASLETYLQLESHL
jgi:hypothetical protein